MKRLLSIALGLTLLLSSMNVSAKECVSSLEQNVLVEKHSIENASKEELMEIMMSDAVSDSLKNKAEEKYISIAEAELEEECRTNNARAGYQTVNYSSTPVSGVKDRKGVYKTMIVTGTQQQDSYTANVSVKAGEIFDAFAISVGGTYSKTMVVSGPAFNTKLPGSSLNATHSVVIGVMRAAITHVTYDLYDGSTGAFIKHVDQYLFSGATVTMYNLLVADLGTSFYVGHCSLNKSKDFDNLTNYKKILESANVAQAYAW